MSEKISSGTKNSKQINKQTDHFFIHFFRMLFNFLSAEFLPSLIILLQNISVRISKNHFCDVYLMHTCITFHCYYSCIGSPGIKKYGVIFIEKSSLKAFIQKYTIFDNKSHVKDLITFPSLNLKVIMLKKSLWFEMDEMSSNRNSIS